MNTARKIMVEEIDVAVGDIVQVGADAEDEAWRGAIGTVEHVGYESGVKPNLVPVATVCVEDLGTSTFATRLLRRLDDTR